jgi:hypothetical protein
MPGRHVHSFIEKTLNEWRRRIMLGVVKRNKHLPITNQKTTGALVCQLSVQRVRKRCLWMKRSAGSTSVVSASNFFLREANNMLRRCVLENQSPSSHHAHAN